MAIKIQNSTIIDDSRNITDARAGTFTQGLDVGVGSSVLSVSTASGGNVFSVKNSSLGSAFEVTGIGSVGIGRSNPRRALHVEGNGLLVGSGITEYFSVEGGISTSTNILEVKNRSNNNILFVNNTSVGFGTTNVLTVTPRTSDYTLAIGTTDIVTLSPNVGSNIFSVTNSGNTLTHLTVSNAGFVGVGTSIPSQRLHVDGNLLVTNGGNEIFSALTTGTNILSIRNQATSPAFDITGIGSVGIGTTQPSSNFQIVSAGSELFSVSSLSGNLSLDVNGNARISGAIYDSTNSPGSTGQFLQSTVTGTQWATASASGGGSGKFDTSIDNVLYVQPTGTLDIVGVGTTATQITTFPAGSREYIIHSIHVTNVSNGDAEVTAGFVMNGKSVPASISVGGGPGIHTITVGSASSIVVGMAVTGTGNIGETVGIGSTAGFQFNTYVTNVSGNILTFDKPLSGIVSGTAVFSPVSKVVSRLPVPVGSAVELLKQPFVLNALDSIVIQSTGAGSGIGSTSTAAISQTSGSNFLTVTAGAAITNFIAAGQLISGTGSNTGIQTNTYVGVGYTPGSLSVPMTRPATSTLASQVLSFTETVVPQDGALQATIVYQSTTELTYNNGVGLAGTVFSAIYGAGPINSATVQSIRVANVSDSGDYPVWVGIGNTDTVFSYLAYNMVVPKNSSIELCEAPKRIGVGHSIFAFSDTANVIEVQVAGRVR